MAAQPMPGYRGCYYRTKEAISTPIKVVTEPEKPELSNGDFFVPINTDPPCVPDLEDGKHPVPATFIKTRSKVVSDITSGPPTLGPKQASTPIQTNKFYGNHFLGDQSCPVFTSPYVLTWAKGGGNSKSWGMGISHLSKEKFAFGKTKPETGAVQYYFCPGGFRHIILSAADLGKDTRMFLDTPRAFTVNVNFCKTADSPPSCSLPLHQGMGFVTCCYYGAQPLVQTDQFFKDVSPAGILNNGATAKFKCKLEDGSTWIIYLTSPDATSISNQVLKMVNNTCCQGPANFKGWIQVCKLPDGATETDYDASCGAYAIACDVCGNVQGDTCTYGLVWTKAGLPDNKLLCWALPHHVESFDTTTAQAVKTLRMDTISNGCVKAVAADHWKMVEKLQMDIGFSPWLPGVGSCNSIGEASRTLIMEAAKKECAEDCKGQCCLDSMYFSGKGLCRWALMALVLNDMCTEKALATTCLNKLKEAMAIFIENKQINPLMYDKTWKGVISSGGLAPDALWWCDFGNTAYNDHHFHYGYHCLAAAIIGYLDAAWLENTKNRNWVTMMVKDYANPVNDEHYPFCRSFDWYYGHSWAKGCGPSADGKDQESSSEDGCAAYAIAMLGRQLGKVTLATQGRLMLAVLRRTIPKYFLMDSSNECHPPNFIGNKVTGIKFENKCDHATWFGMNPEYIQGIQCIPVTAVSAYLRPAKFIKEEWQVYWDKGRVDKVEGGWRGILMCNLAAIDPSGAYNFFAQKDFDYALLDPGCSRTWALAYCAALAAGGTG